MNFILTKFGFDPELFLFQIINFLVIFYIIKRFLYKPIQKIYHERQKKIKKVIDEAIISEDVLNITYTDRIHLLKESRKESDKILKTAKEIGEEIRLKAKEEADKEAAKIIARAKVEAEIEKEKMNKEAKNTAIEISEKLLTNILGTVFSEQEKEQIIEKAISELDKSKNNEEKYY